ncbi:MAG: DUF393 domain-containing protein [Myxococcales bacterium]
MVVVLPIPLELGGRAYPRDASRQHRHIAGIPTPVGPSGRGRTAIEASHQDHPREGPLAVFFDGACIVCSSEMESYRRRDRDGRLEFVDIAAPGFDAQAFGLDRVQVQRAMHVRLPSGEVRTGVAAFVEVWKRLPGFGLAARVAANPLLRPLLSAGYWVFARLIRPVLPKRRRGCESGACQLERGTGEWAAGQRR